MRVFLAGASGVIGRALIPRLLEAGHEVLGLTRTPGSLAGTGAQEIVADIRDRDAFLAMASGMTIDAVVDQLTALRRAPTRYRDMRATNRLRSEGTNTLVAAARAMRAKKFVAASIVYGYGFADLAAETLDESAPFATDTEGRTAAVQEALLSLEQQVHAFGGVSLRYGLFYSATSAVSPVSSDWDGVLPYVHVEDAAAATVLALAKGRRGAVYNIVDDEPVSWRALNEALAAAQGTRARPHRSWLIELGAPFGANLVTRTALRVSNTLAKRQLGWKLAYPTYRDGLAVGGGQ
jgi:nucleoside-diphosphate-sugar epimerase